MWSFSFWCVKTVRRCWIIQGWLHHPYAQGSVSRYHPVNSLFLFCFPQPRSILLILFHFSTPFSFSLILFLSVFLPPFDSLLPLPSLFPCLSLNQEDWEEDEHTEKTKRSVHVEGGKDSTLPGSCHFCSRDYFQGQRPAVTHGTTETAHVWQRFCDRTHTVTLTEFLLHQNK